MRVAPKKLSIAARRRLSRAHTGLKHSPEHAAAIAAGCTGKKHTPETIEKIRRARLNKIAAGGTATEEQIRHLRETCLKNARLQNMYDDMFLAAKMKRGDWMRDVYQSDGWADRRQITDVWPISNGFCRHTAQVLVTCKP